MFLPIGDEPNLRGTPFVTYTLLALNALIFLMISLPLMGQPIDVRDPAVDEFLRFLLHQSGDDIVPSLAQKAHILRQHSAYDLFTFKHGFKPADASLMDLFYSMFLHGGWLHLLGNMLFLWIYGDNVELTVGRLPFLLIYLGTGMCASAFHMLFSLGSLTPMIGASGAISGVLGCYFLWFPHNRVKMVVVLVFFIQVVLIPARWVLGFYLIVENLLPFLLAPAMGGGGVAHGAHIGGFLGGLGVAYVLQRYGHLPEFVQARGRRAFRQARKEAEAFVAPRQAFTDALRAERYEAALKAYSEMSLAERNLLDGHEVMVLADWLADVGRAELALTVLQRFIGSARNAPELARAHLRAGLVQLYGLGRPVAAREHLLASLSLDPPPNVRAAAEEALGHIDV